MLILAAKASSSDPLPALLGVIVGALLAVGGGYLATRAVDRRQRRAEVLELFTDMELNLALLPGDFVGPLWRLADRAYRSAMATSPKDARLAATMLDEIDRQRDKLEVDWVPDDEGQVNRVEREGSAQALVELTRACDAYIDHVCRKLRVERRSSQAGRAKA